MITGIAHAAFTVSDMDRSVAFYEKVLGFHKAFELRKDDGSPWIVYLKAAPNQFLELFYADPDAERPAIPSGAPQFNHICFAVSDIHETAAFIGKNGGKLTSPVSQGKDRNYQCWTADPDGNRIELMQMSPDSPQAKA